MGRRRRHRPTQKINNQEGPKEEDANVEELLETSKNSKGNTTRTPKGNLRTWNHIPENKKIKSSKRKLEIAHEESDEAKQTTPEKSDIGDETKSEDRIFEENMKHLDKYSDRHIDCVEFQKCYNMILNYEKDRRNWKEEKNRLLSQISCGKRILDQVSCFKEQSRVLVSKLTDVMISLEQYKSIENNFTKAQRMWGDEKRTMFQTIDMITIHCDTYFQSVVGHEMCIDRLEKERDKLIVEVNDEKSMSEYLKSCLMKSEEKCYYLSEENKHISERIVTSSPMEELEKKMVKLEEKLVQLEKERDDFASQIAAAKASCGCLNDLDS